MHIHIPIHIFVHSCARIEIGFERQSRQHTPGRPAEEAEAGGYQGLWKAYSLGLGGCAAHSSCVRERVEMLEAPIFMEMIGAQSQGDPPNPNGP